MKKINIKQRLKNAGDAFFADETFDANQYLSFRNEAALLQNEKSDGCAPLNNFAESALKQVFLFFPGTTVLFFLSMGFTAMAVNSLITPLGITSRYELSRLLTLFLATILMTWLGLGDVRKPKHFVIPASVITIGIFFGTIASVLIVTSHQLTRFIFSNAYPLYLLPLALVVPFLAKGWVDRKD